MAPGLRPIRQPPMRGSFEGYIGGVFAGYNRLEGVFSRFFELIDESWKNRLKDSNSLRKIVSGYPFSDQCGLVAAFDFDRHIYCLGDLPHS